MKILHVLVASISAVLGFGASGQQAQTVDPKSLLFSTCTLNDNLPAMDQHKTLPTKHYSMHEDDWRNFEFLSSDFQTSINSELGIIAELKKTQSVPVGEYFAFKKVHVRSIFEKPINTPVPLSELISVLGPTAVKTDVIALNGATHPIQNGFQINVDGFLLYGVSIGENVAVLGLDMGTRPHFSRERAQKVANWFSAKKLILVHWPGVRQFSGPDGLGSYFDPSWK